MQAAPQTLTGARAGKSGQGPRVRDAGSQLLQPASMDVGNCAQWVTCKSNWDLAHTAQRCSKTLFGRRRPRVLCEASRLQTTTKMGRKMRTLTRQAERFSERLGLGTHLLPAQEDRHQHCQEPHHLECRFISSGSRRNGDRIEAVLCALGLGVALLACLALHCVLTQAVSADGLEQLAGVHRLASVHGGPVVLLGATTAQQHT